MLFTLFFAHSSMPGELLNDTLSTEDGLGRAQDTFITRSNHAERNV